MAFSQTEASVATAATLIKYSLELLMVAEAEAAKAGNEDGPQDTPPTALSALFPLRDQLQQVGFALSAAAPKPLAQETVKNSTNLDDPHDPFAARVDDEGDLDIRRCYP